MSDAEETWTWASVRDQVKPREDVVPLCLDGTVQRRLEVARKRLRDAQRQSDGTLDSGLGDLRAEVDALEAEAEAATRDFTIRAIPHAAWRELLIAHPGDDGERYNAATFVPAAIAACCPHFDSAEQVAAAAEDADHGLTTGQVTKLFSMARLLNEGDDRVPFVRSG